MSYYDPLYPSIEATRNEIQRSILALQDKLRLVTQQQFQRRQIDLDIQLSRNQQIARRAYQDQLHYRQALAHSDRIYASAYEKAVAEKFKYAQEQQSQNLRHLSKIQQLQRERLQLSLERQRMNSIMGRNSGYVDNRSPFKNIPAGYDEDQTLLKKYQDGTRARQYIDQIDSYGNSRQKYSSATKNSKTGIASEFDRSPYNNLKYDSERKGFGHQNFKNTNPLTNDKISGNSQYREENQRRQQYQTRQPRFGQRKQFSNNKNKQQLRGILKNNQTADFERRKQKNPQNYDQNIQEPIPGSKPYKSFFEKDGNQQTFGLIDSSKKSNTPIKGNISSSRGRSKSHKQLNSSKKNTGQSDYSPYLSYLEPNLQRSPSKSKRATAKKSTLQRSRNLGPPQVNAMQKIKNRLKVSEIVYKDSKFKNVKHQLSHLFNTYECQTKLRKEIKEKINNHPMVLKKHAMVID